MSIAFISAFVLYFCVLFAIGYAVHKKNATSQDMLMGSRSLNFWVTALSAQASDMSSWMFMAFPMSLLVKGLPEIWIGIAVVLGMYANWHFVAPRLRTETEKYGALTISSYFGKRFHDTRGTIRLLSAVMSLLFLTYYVAAGLISFGLLFESFFGLDYLVGIIAATVVMIAYTFIGGYVSVAWVDLFQALFLLAAIIIVPIIAFMKIDGIQDILASAHAANIPMTFLPENAFAILSPLLGWGLGYFGMPHIITKFMGIKDPKELTKAKYLGITWEVLALIAAACVGLVGIAYFKNGLDNPELVFIQMVKELFHPFPAGLLLCGVMAATISTMDSQILVCASVIAEDIYKLFNKNVSSKKEVKVFRLGVVVISLIALWISLYRSATIMDTVYYAWAGLGSSFAPLVLAALYSKKVNLQGAIAGILTGGTVAATWPTVNYYLAEHGIIGLVPSMIPGFTLGTIMIFLVSYLTSKKSHQVA
jgi:solute:Na+ symporter, SSS family